MKKFYILLSIVFVVVLNSCAVEKKIANTSCPGYRKVDFQRIHIQERKMAILPVLGGEEKEAFRRPMGEAITKYTKVFFGDENIKSPSQVISVINDNQLAGSYSTAIVDYATTGIVPRELVIKMGDVLAVRYLFYSRLLSKEESEIIDLGYNLQTGTSHSSIQKFDELYVQSQVWDAKIGDVVWEGKGGTVKMKEVKMDMLDETAKNLVFILGNEKGDGACESKDDIIKSIKKASSQSTGCYIVSLLFLLVGALAAAAGA